ncbi:extracellular solute-binding protein [Paenibacillus nasutitermitis]|uniref:ABC transporter substrate-binding protein n=1 Tax=Paenibacillus nasutitermitis TaxID=1652958 RepID=A0A916ZG89_9BACL|nr:extracellular solute-binding protein [Paenibacillus nasutitermitis]GGD94760.1 ABC transporter substrate-binding protein [Paenibacillus nasutitermitis]
MPTKKIRNAALLLVIMMIISSIAACSGGNKNKNTSNISTDNKNTETSTPSAPAVIEPVKLKVFAEWLTNPLNNSIPNDPVMQEITKKTGITLDFEPFTGGGDGIAKLSVLLASDDLPDLIITSDVSMVNKLIQTKQVLPLDDLLKTNGSNITTNFQDALDKYSVIYPNADNKHYFVKALIDSTEFNQIHHSNAWNIRWDLYKKLGKPKMDTLDEYLEVLKQMQQLEPVNKEGKKNYGLGVNLGDPWGIFIVTKATMNAQGLIDSGKATHILDLNKNEVVPFFTDPEGKMWDVMKFYNKAYQEGVLDPESVTMKFANLGEKAGAGRYMSLQAGWLGTTGGEEKFVTEGTPEKGFVPLPVWMNSEKSYLLPKNAIGNQFFWLVSAKSAHPERVMDLMNYLATPQGLELVTNGPEGIGWDMVDGKPVLKPEIIALKKADPEKFTKTVAAGQWFHLSIYGSEFEPNGTRTNFYSEPALMQEEFKPFQKDFLQDMGYTYPSEGLDKIPNNSFSNALIASISPPVGSDIATKEASLNTYMATAAAAVIFSKTDADFVKGKEKFISELKKLGADEVFKFYYDKYEEIKGKE